MNAPAVGAALADWLAYQETLHKHSIELGLERVGEVARALGLAAAGAVTLTIGGTNGKGSSATLAASICRAAGYRVGLYTSPHLLRYNERIAVDGVEVGDAEICTAFAAIEQARGSVPLTYFEFGTLAALWLFRALGVQVQVLEVGLGGRLDAVNLIDADAALVTSIGLDHTDWLGADRESIAAEKAAIFRPGRPAVCADPDPPATIAGGASKIGAQLLQLGRDFEIRERDRCWDWLSPQSPGDGELLGLPLPALRGGAQLRNAAGVIAMLRSLQQKLPVPEQAIRSGLLTLKLAGRFDVRGNTVFDVAHNAEAAMVLAANLDLAFPGRRAGFVLGMLAGKPCAAFVRSLRPNIDTLHLVSLPPPRGLRAEELRQQIGDAGRVTSMHDSIGTALDQARTGAGADGVVVVTGSFLTVAAGLMHG